MNTIKDLIEKVESISHKSVVMINPHQQGDPRSLVDGYSSRPVFPAYSKHENYEQETIQNNVRFPYVYTDLHERKFILKNSLIVEFSDGSKDIFTDEDFEGLKNE